MTKFKLEKGKKYLRDIRNGRVHPYEEGLAQMAYVEQFIEGDENSVVKAASMHVSLNSQERAAEFDRLAAMTPDDRKAEQTKAAKSEPEKEESKPPAPKPPAPKPPAPKPPAPPAKKQ